MDSNTMILILVSALVLTAIYGKRFIEQRKRKAFDNELIKLTESKDINAFKTEYLPTKVIVLDIVNKKLLLVQRRNVKKYDILDLTGLTACKLRNKHLMVHLDLRFNTPKRESFSMVFYKKYFDPQNKRRALVDTARQWRNTLIQETNLLTN